MSQGAARRSPLLNPWVLGTILALAAVTLMRPFMVRRPDPPPAGARVPAVALVDQHGRALDTTDLVGRAWVAALLPAEPSERSERAFEALLKLQDGFARLGVDGAWLVAVAAQPRRQAPEALRAIGVRRGADLSRFKLLTGGPGATCALGGLFADPPGAPCEELPALAAQGRLLLVDAEGRTRGLYRSDALGVEEVFHRTLSVLPGG